MRVPRYRFWLANLSTNPEVYTQLVRKGGIETCVRFLTIAQDVKAQQFAALAIANMASTKALCNNIVRLDGVVAGLVQFVGNEQGNLMGRLIATCLQNQQLTKRPYSWELSLH